MVVAPIERVLLVTAGPTFAVYDVFTGLLRGLRAIGVEAYPFDTGTRVEDSVEWLRHLSRQRGQAEDAWTATDPSAALFHTGEQSVVRALEMRADAAIFITGMYVDWRIPELFHRAGIPTFLYGTESPYDDDVFLRIMPRFAVASTNDRASLPAYEAAVRAAHSSTRTLFLPLAYDPEAHFPGAGADLELAPAHDVVFVGNVFPSREPFLTTIDWAAEGIDLGLYGEFQCMSVDSPLWRYTARGATPEDPHRIVDNRVTTALHGKAKIALNFFREERFRGDKDDPETWRNPSARLVGAESVNPRLFECAASGAFVLSQWRAELDGLTWANVPTFRTPGEMAALVRHYLEYPDERAAIAARLPDAVRGHSYVDRARTIVGILGGARAEMLAQRVG